MKTFAANTMWSLKLPIICPITICSHEDEHPSHMTLPTVSKPLKRTIPKRKQLGWGDILIRVSVRENNPKRGPAPFCVTDLQESAPLI